MLDIERWVKWAKEKGFELRPSPPANCDICVKAMRSNGWMIEESWRGGMRATVCEEHAREYGLLW